VSSGGEDCCLNDDTTVRLWDVRTHKHTPAGHSSSGSYTNRGGAGELRSSIPNVTTLDASSPLQGDSVGLVEHRLGQRGVPEQLVPMAAAVLRLAGRLLEQRALEDRDQHGDASVCSAAPAHSATMRAVPACRSHRGVFCRAARTGARRNGSHALLGQSPALGLPPSKVSASNPRCMTMSLGGVR
jgi:hypothetical protein